MPIVDRRHTSSLLKDLRNRLFDLCSENSRDDLADAVYIFYSLARTNPGAIGARDRIRSCIANDDDLLNVTKELQEYYQSVNQACAERDAGAVLH